MSLKSAQNHPKCEREREGALGEIDKIGKIGNVYTRDPAI